MQAFYVLKNLKKAVDRRSAALKVEALGRSNWIKLRHGISFTSRRDLEVFSTAFGALKL